MVIVDTRRGSNDDSFETCRRTAAGCVGAGAIMPAEGMEPWGRLYLADNVASEPVDAVVEATSRLISASGDGSTVTTLVLVTNTGLMKVKVLRRVETKTSVLLGTSTVTTWAKTVVVSEIDVSMEELAAMVSISSHFDLQTTYVRFCLLESSITALPSCLSGSWPVPRPVAA